MCMDTRFYRGYRYLMRVLHELCEKASRALQRMAVAVWGRESWFREVTEHHRQQQGRLRRTRIFGGRFRDSGIARICQVLALVALASVLRYLAMPLREPGLSSIMFYPVVLFGAWHGGMLLGGLATVLSVTSLVFIADHHLTAASKDTPLFLSALLLEGLMLSYLVHVLFRRVFRAKEQQLRYLETFICEAPVAIAMFDRKMRYLAASSRWLSDYGSTLSGVVRKAHHDVFPEIPERWRAVCDRCLSGAVERAEEDLFIRNDGSQQWLRWEVRPWYWEDEVGGILIFSEDISSRKSAELRAHEAHAQRQVQQVLRAQAERVTAERDEFLANLSHELRTPLHAILGWAYLLKRIPYDPERLREGVSAIERSSRALNQLISDLLDVNRLSSGKLRLQVKDVSVTQLVDHALESVMPEAQARNITLCKVSSIDEVSLRGDPSRLEQCLLNLITNSLKFTPSGGKIEVGAQRVGSTIEIAVRDTGRGMAPEFLPHVFERFSQSDPSRTREYGGLGLGLSIVKRLVELHGGTVSAASPGPHQGSTFTLILPCHTSTEGAAVRDPEKELSEQGSECSGSTILVVDDDLEARELIRRVLEAHGARVVLGASAQQGLEIAGNLRPDMIISDIAMPRKDGCDFLRELRAMLPDVPAMALTAHVRDEDLRKVYAAGFASCHSKPVEVRELLDDIAALLSGRKGRGAAEEAGAS